MAADVGSLVRVLGSYGGDEHPRRHQTAGKESTGESTALITRDFLGGSAAGVEAQELDLDLEVPSGYEKRLDLKSGKVYVQRCNTPTSATSSSEQKHQTVHQSVPKLQDLNFPPSSSKQPLLNLFEERTSLDLKLFPSQTTASSPCNYQSVCTLDKVKSALERAERHSTKKHHPPATWSGSSSPSHSSSSFRGIGENREENSMSSSPPAGVLFAAGCPSCLMYVLISKSNPKCPRCNTFVPTPAITAKKPRLDLNISV